MRIAASALHANLEIVIVALFRHAVRRRGGEIWEDADFAPLQITCLFGVKMPTTKVARQYDKSPSG